MCLELLTRLVQEDQVHAAAFAASTAAAHVVAGAAESDLKRAARIDAQAGLELDRIQMHAD
jgi:hypothetical protein